MHVETLLGLFPGGGLYNPYQTFIIQIVNPQDTKRRDKNLNPYENPPIEVWYKEKN